MWSETARRQYRREDRRYANGTADALWAVVEPHLPAAKIPRTGGLATPARFSEPLDGAALPCAWRAAGLWETSKSVKTTESGGPGYACARARHSHDPCDASRRITGRQRHIITTPRDAPRRRSSSATIAPPAARCCRGARLTWSQLPAGQGLLGSYEPRGVLASVRLCAPLARSTLHLIRSL
jgi:hypothetical protein